MAGSSIEIVPDARRDLISELPAKAQTKHQRIVPDANRDLISELPLELKVSILECLPTRDAARTVLLSTHWNDVWLLLGRLAFDFNFFCDIRKCSGKSIVPYKIITYILLQRVQPVKKFSLHLSALFDPTLEQSNLDEWCLYLSRNGIEELDISCSNHCYKLPFCIVSCPTIKQLELWELGIDCPINAPSIFPGVISLVFVQVLFNHNVNGIMSSIPNLEKLKLVHCEDGLHLIWKQLRFFAWILTACRKWENVEVASFPTAIKLQVIKLDSINFANEKQVMGVLKLLQKSPNLCELHIAAILLDDDIHDDDIHDDDIHDDDIHDDDIHDDVIHHDVIHDDDIHDDDIQYDDIQYDDIQYDDIQDGLLLLEDPDSCIVQDPD